MKPLAYLLRTLGQDTKALLRHLVKPVAAVTISGLALCPVMGQSSDSSSMPPMLQQWLAEHPEAREWIQTHPLNSHMAQTTYLGPVSRTTTGDSVQYCGSPAWFMPGPETPARALIPSLCGQRNWSAGEPGNEQQPRYDAGVLLEEAWPDVSPRQNTFSIGYNFRSHNPEVCVGQRLVIPRADIGVGAAQCWEIDNERGRELREVIEADRQRRAAAANSTPVASPVSQPAYQPSQEVLAQELQDTLRYTYNPPIEQVRQYYQQRGLSADFVARQIQAAQSQMSGASYQPSGQSSYAVPQASVASSPMGPVAAANSAATGGTWITGFNENAPRNAGSIQMPTNRGAEGISYNDRPPVSLGAGARGALEDARRAGQERIAQAEAFNAASRPAGVWDSSRPRYHNADGSFDAQGNRVDYQRPRYDTNGNRLDGQSARSYSTGPGTWQSSSASQSSTSGNAYRRGRDASSDSGSSRSDVSDGSRQSYASGYQRGATTTSRSDSGYSNSGTNYSRNSSSQSVSRASQPEVPMTTQRQAGSATRTAALEMPK